MRTAGSWSPRGGFDYTYRQTIDNRDLELFLYDLRLSGYEYSFDAVDGKPITIVSFKKPQDGANNQTPPPGEEIAPLWEIIPVQKEMDLWDIPLVQAEFAQLIRTSSNATTQIVMLKKMVKAWIENGDVLDEEQLDSNGKATTVITPNLTIILNKIDEWHLNRTIWDLVLRTMHQKVEAYPIHSFSARRTRIVLPTGNINGDVSNSNRMFSMASFQAIETPPDIIKFHFPTVGFMLKKAPSVSQQQNGSWAIVQDWDYVPDYAPLIYGTPL